VELTYAVYERNNAFASNGTEWVFSVRFDGGNGWVIHTWERPPTEDQIDGIKTIVLRSMDVYHRHLEPPVGITSVERVL
jgi:hypothetical protein